MRVIENAYYIEDGFIKVYKPDKKGNEITFSILKPGSLLPLLTLFNQYPNKFYFDTLTGCKLRLIPINDIYNLIDDNKFIQKEILLKLLKISNILSTKIEVCISYNSLVKISNTVVYLCKNFGIKKNDTVDFPIFITHEFISSMSGTTRETTSRNLEELAHRSILTLGYHRLRIQNLSELERIAQGN